MKGKYIIIMCLIFINCQIGKTAESSEEQAEQVEKIASSTEIESILDQDDTNFDFPEGETEQTGKTDLDLNEHRFDDPIEEEIEQVISAIWDLMDKKNNGFIFHQHLLSNKIPTKYHKRISAWLKKYPGGNGKHRGVINKTKFTLLLFDTLSLPQLKKIHSNLM